MTKCSLLIADPNSLHRWPRWGPVVSPTPLAGSRQGLPVLFDAYAVSPGQSRIIPPARGRHFTEVPGASDTLVRSDGNRLPRATNSSLALSEGSNSQKNATLPATKADDASLPF
jgi:hypothetical protein